MFLHVHCFQNLFVIQSCTRLPEAIVLEKKSAPKNVHVDEFEKYF